MLKKFPKELSCLLGAQHLQKAGFTVKSLAKNDKVGLFFATRG
jgi:hypothetical protein